jgi:hypothetical protein
MSHDGPAGRPCRRSDCALLRAASRHDGRRVPAYVNGFRMDILGWGGAAAALFGNWAELPPEEHNRGRLIFLSPARRDLFVEWGSKTAVSRATLRPHAGIHPEDPQLASGGSMRTEEFGRLWAAHEVRRSGGARPRGPSSRARAYCGSTTRSSVTSPRPTRRSPCPTTPTRRSSPTTAEPGSASAALRLLASWGATPPHQPSEPHSRRLCCGARPSQTHRRLVR